MVVFMKGVRASPQCGFSSAAVELLDGYLEDYTCVDVLNDTEIREGLKEYSRWPTVPQFYFDGELLGGLDILQELHQNGQLRELFGELAYEVSPPNVDVTPATIAAVLQAVGPREGPIYLRLRINAQFYNDLSIDPPQPGDVVIDVVSPGLAELGRLKMVFDPASARRAHGVSIDFVQEGDESGFRVDNPNMPAQVKQLSVQELAQRIAEDDDDFILVDVRTDDERKVCALAGSRQLTPDTRAELLALPKTSELIFICHHGSRSQRAAQSFVDSGFSNVFNVIGGMDAWAREIDPTMRRY
jgi:monothiol glutaredoxin